MTQKTIQSKIAHLKEELTELNKPDHLKDISVQLIELYRSKSFHSIQGAYRSVYFPAIHGSFDDAPAKAFLSLIKSIHPDRSASYAIRIDSSAEAGNLEELAAMKSLFKVEFARSSKVHDGISPGADFDFDSSEWMYDVYSDFDDIVESESEEAVEETDPIQSPHSAKTFIEALVIEEPGLAEEPSLQWILRNLESLDLSGYGIQDLSGLELCTNVTELNLENNLIDDIAMLRPLIGLRTLLLGSNAIETIQDLASLVVLEELDLSFNEISDVSSLLSLNKLKLVNLVGCPVNATAIAALEERGVAIVH